MDSGNTSGSLQSSSGDDQEYDSRAAQTTSSSSNFLINSYNNNNNTGNNINNSSLSHHQPLSMFDPLSNFFDQNNNHNTNSMVNHDTIWSKNLRSETDFTGFIATSSSTSPTQQFFTPNVIGNNNNNNNSSMQFPVQNNTNKESVSGPTMNNNNIGVTVRNPKKRSRASRRAPTTVLTTDTSNFRAMVQEFTGIPAPPFTSSLFPRTTTRLDLFSGGGRSTNLDNPPFNLLRPFAQKPTSLNPFINHASSDSPTPNYQQQQQPQNLLNNINMQNPFLNFQPLLQPNTNKYPALGNSKQTSEIPSSNNDRHLKIGVLEDEFGLNTHGQVSVDHAFGTSNDLLRSINGGGNYSNSSNGKLINVNLSSAASSSEFHLDKGPPENNVTRSEGMVESWICSSD